MAGLHFDITGNNTDFIRKLKETEQGISQTSKRIESEGSSIESYFNKIAKGAAAIGLGFSATQLIKDIVQVRGEFQQLEIAFETMLKSRDKASALMGQLTETAAKTPFDLQGVAQGAKQLLAYGTASEEVNDTLIRLGNIASGLSIPLGDLVYLYGTTQTQGRLFTQDVRQFMGRGIPLVKELAAELGKTEQQINEMVTEGKIGFPEVEKVIRNMTSESGQFYNLMEKQSASLTGQISNLGDAWDMMLNKLGTETQGIASAGISAVTSLVENYEEVGVVLASLAASYGTYKAAIIVVNTLEKANTMIMRQAIIEKKLAAAANITLSNSMAVAAARGKMFALVQRNIVSSFKGIGKTLANPYVLLGAAVGAATYGLYKFYTRETEVEQMQRQYNETKEATVRHENEHKAKVDELISSLENETTAQMERVGAIETLKQLYPDIIEKYIDEEGHLKNLIALNKELAEFDATKKMEQNKTDLHSYDERIKNQEEYINRMRTNDQSAFDDEVAKLDELKRQREITREKVASDYINSSISSSKSMSDDELKRTIATYQKALSENTNGEWFDSNQEFKVDEINRYITALKDLQTARANAIKNKEYWESEKKNAESQLAALSDVEAAGKKGLALKQKIAEYEKKLINFSVSSSKQESESDKFRKQQEKLKSLQETQSRDRIRQTKDLEFEVVQSKIDAMQDGSDKSIAQMQLNHKKEIETLKRNREDYLKKKIDAEKALFEANPDNKGKFFDSSKVSLNKEEEGIFKSLLKSTIAKQGNDISSYYKDLLSKYQGYTEKRLAVQKKFQEERDALTKAGASKETLAEHDYQRDETLQSVDNEFAMREDSFKTWADNIANLSLEKLREMLVQAEQELQRSEFLNPNDKGLATQRAKVTSLKNTINEKTEKTNTSPNKRSQKEWQDLYKTLSKVEKGFDEIGRTVGGTAGEIISAAGSIASSTLQMIDGITTLATSSSSAMSGTAQTASASVKAVEKASVILAVIGAALQIAMKIASLFNNDAEYQKEIERLQGRIEQLQWELDNADTVRLQNNSFKALQKVKDVYAETTDEVLKLHSTNDKYANGLYKMFGRVIHHNEIMQKSAEKLALAYANIDYTADKALGTEKFSNAKNQLQNIAQQQLLIQEQIRNEDSKKKTDHGKIEDWERQIQELGEKANAIINEIVEGIIGGSAADIASELGDAFIEAFQDGENAAEAWGDKVNDIVANVLKRMLVSKYLEEPLGKIFDKYKSKWYKDGEFAGIDAIMESMGGFANDLNDVGSEFHTIWEALPDTIKGMFTVDDSESSSQSATSKGFQAMSQDSADELNGRFTALQITGEEIKNQTMQQTSILQMIYGLVSDIVIPMPTSNAGDAVVPTLSGANPSSSSDSTATTQLIALNQITNSLLGVTQTGLNELVNLNIQANSYLDDIAGFQKKILAILDSRLANIERSTKTMAGN